MGIGMLLAALVIGAAGPAYLRRAVDAAARPGVALGAWIGTGVVFVSLLVAAPVVTTGVLVATVRSALRRLDRSLRAERPTANR